MECLAASELSSKRQSHSFRLEIALHLLSNNSLNISEIAYKVGFNDPKYFSKCFKKILGLSPTKYRESIEQISIEDKNRIYDELFLKKAIIKLEMKISDGSFSINQFARDMNVSTASLYRKFKSTFELSPCEFIRSVRIKRSVQLLTRHKNISEVAFEVGFNDSKYFSRCFKREFGMTPKEFKLLSIIE